MVPVLTSAVTLAGALLLLAAGAVHLRARPHLRSVLRVQGLLPRRLWGPISAGLGAVELVVAGAVLLAFLAAPALIGATALAQTALYATFTVYLWILRSRKAGAPCGCFGGNEPVTWLVVIRSAAITLASAGAALFSPETEALPPPTRALYAAGGLVLAMIAWLTKRVL